MNHQSIINWSSINHQAIISQSSIINSSSIPLVVKADGLASGKGVFIPDSKDECFKAAESIFNGRFGNSGSVVVLEEKIQGPEVSVFALCDGKRYTLLPTAQDHKRLNEKDKGQIFFLEDQIAQREHIYFKILND